MRRADRLIQIAQFMRSQRNATTAQQIADKFQISVRTVYRDIEDLIYSGAPIRGEAGIGYVIDKDYYLPPISFDKDEIEAISLGISMVRFWTDKKFAQKADQAFQKITAVLPKQRQDEIDQITTFSGPNKFESPWQVSFSALREAIREKEKLHIQYEDLNNNFSNRMIHPLALVFFSPVWLLVSWCEMRNDFRNFRLDRIQNVIFTLTYFEDEPQKNLAAFLKKEAACLG